jgi:hypothetical protein
MTLAGSEPDPLQAVAEEFLERHRRGERPAVDEYKARYPALADRIDDLFPALAEIEEFGSVVVPRTGSPGRYGLLRPTSRSSR